MSSVFQTALSGMNAATQTLLTATKNIVNVSSTGQLPSAENEKATSYAPQDVIAIATSSANGTSGVTTKTVSRDPSYYTAYDPSSPNANADGLIAAPNVDLAQEAVTILTAKLNYEANAKVIGVQKDMQESLLDTLA